MAQNEFHPVFAKDARLVHDFNDWFLTAAAALTNLAQKRRLQESLDQTNALAQNIKAQALAALDRLDTEFGVKPDGPTAFAEANPQRAPKTPLYQQERAQLFTRFSQANNRIWTTRAYHATELDRALDRQEIKAVTKRHRMPTQILEAAKSAPSLQQATTAYDQLTKRPAPQPRTMPTLNQERA